MNMNSLLLIFSLAALGLQTGCAHDVALRTTEGKPIGKATLVFDSNKAGTLSIKIDEISYSGDWIAEKVDESGAVSKRYGLGSRRYNEYVTGRGNYLWRGTATLNSMDGNSLHCEFTFRGNVSRGTCHSEDSSFDFVGEG